MLLKGYYFITDAKLSRAGNISDVKNAVASGVKIVQYRNKYSGTRQMYEEALKLKQICKGVTFIINDRVDIALGVNADGVHLGNDDMPYNLARKLLGKKKVIGLTVHSVKDAIKAQKMGADYIGVSPIFATKTKNNAGKPAGAGLIKLVKKRVSIPIVAIGGINLENAQEAIASGADAVCAISAVVAKIDVKEQIKRFQSLF